jgi:hypothetical protein
VSTLGLFGARQVAQASPASHGGIGQAFVGRTLLDQSPQLGAAPEGDDAETGLHVFAIVIHGRSSSSKSVHLPYGTVRHKIGTAKHFLSQMFPKCGLLLPFLAED